MKPFFRIRINCLRTLIVTIETTPAKCHVWSYPEINFCILSRILLLVSNCKVAKFFLDGLFLWICTQNGTKNLDLIRYIPHNNNNENDKSWVLACTPTLGQTHLINSYIITKLNDMHMTTRVFKIFHKKYNETIL